VYCRDGDQGRYGMDVELNPVLRESYIIPIFHPVPHYYGSVHLIVSPHILLSARFDQSTSYLSHPSVPRLIRPALHNWFHSPAFLERHYSLYPPYSLPFTTHIPLALHSQLTSAPLSLSLLRSTTSIRSSQIPPLAPLNLPSLAPLKYLLSPLVSVSH